MADVANITEHMEVVSSDGEHVGTIDHMEGDDMIRLTRDDAHHHHHFIPNDRVSGVSDTVRLDKTRDEVLAQWTHE